MSHAGKQCRGWDDDRGMSRFIPQWRAVTDESVEDLVELASETFFACQDREVFRDGLNCAFWFSDAVLKERERRRETDPELTEPACLVIPFFEPVEITGFLTAFDAILRACCLDSLAQALVNAIHRTLICQLHARLKSSNT